MKVKKGMKKKWDKYVKINKDDGYSKCCIDCTIRVGDNLDKGMKPENAFDEGIKGSDITGFMAGVIAGGIAKFHPRGEEFRKWWNIDNQIKDEGERANKKKDAVLNPALVTISTK